MKIAHYPKYILSLASIALISCTSPQYDKAYNLSFTSPGNLEQGQCFPFAADLAPKLRAQGVECYRVWFRQQFHGEGLYHVAVCFKADDGWWYIDNQMGPVQVSTHGSWEDRVNDALAYSGTALSFRTAKEAAMRSSAGTIGAYRPELPLNSTVYDIKVTQ